MEEYKTLLIYINIIKVLEEASKKWSFNMSFSDDTMDLQLGDTTLHVHSMDVQMPHYQPYYMGGGHPRLRPLSMGYEFRINGILYDGESIDNLRMYSYEHISIPFEYNNNTYDCYIESFNITHHLNTPMMYELHLITMPDLTEPTPPPLPQKPTLDQQYPHRCHRCDKNLHFHEFVIYNPTEKKEHLEELWITKEVKLLCCTCHRNKHIEPIRRGWGSEDDVSRPDFLDSMGNAVRSWSSYGIAAGIITTNTINTMPDDCVGTVEWNGEVSGVDTPYGGSVVLGATIREQLNDYRDMQERIIWMGTEPDGFVRGRSLNMNENNNEDD